MSDMTPIPSDFLHSDEHPMLAVPFTLTLDGLAMTGDRLSMTHLTAMAEGTAPRVGQQGAARLRIDFPEFSITLSPIVRVTVVDGGGVGLVFVDPTGPHLPQLRYVLNAVIAGELTSLDGLMTYSGPTAPKAARAVQNSTLYERLRSILVIGMSFALIATAASVLLNRATTGTELHPVFVEADGRVMRATAPGQISFLNPGAGAGEVIFALTSNAGDVLNFQMPCDCEVSLSANAYEGATLLPSDEVLTILPVNPDVRARTLMSIEGFSRAMTGHLATVKLTDGRKIRVQVVRNEASTTALMSGDPFVPVELRAQDGTLTDADIGAAGRLTLSSPLLSGLLPEF